MTTRVVSVLPDAPVSRAVDLMRRYGFSALPVTNTRYHLVGMISLLDVIRLRESQPWAADDARVEEVMTPNPLSMAPTAKPASARPDPQGEARCQRRGRETALGQAPPSLPS